VVHYRHLVRPEAVPVGSDLRVARLSARISLQAVADALGSWPTRISELERGLTHDTALARRYVKWLDERSADAPEAAQLVA
jgi:transcriptional regulator with XRE-family HTH domain